MLLQLGRNKGMNMIDFRSDTVTKPTKDMRIAMMNAIVGDDVYEDDPTIKELEALAAKMTGKEASLFVTSGTMGNQLAIYIHTNRGDEIICGTQSHIKNYEVGASAVISGVSYHLIEEENSMMPLDKISNGVRGVDVHYPDTSLICLENAHGNGVVLPLEYMETVRKLASEKNVKVHLDGARLFNAATHLNVDAIEITKYVDSVTFCLSKGLAAPIGSMLCGTKEFIAKARRGRKLLGGGMRQVGVLGAPGIIALQEMTKRLNEDHLNAQYLASKLNKIDGFNVDMDHLEINMVFVKSTHNLEKLTQFVRQFGIILGGYNGEYMRIAIHNDISQDNIDLLLKKIIEFIKE